MILFASGNGFGCQAGRKQAESTSSDIVCLWGDPSIIRQKRW
jgi:hypothetical protein